MDDDTLSSQTAGSKFDGACWMQGIDDDTLLSDMTLPGTHDSGATFGGSTTQTQRLSIEQQLLAGVRFLDIRCCQQYDLFNIYHGPVPQPLSFGQVQQACASFLTDHPSEALIMSIKREAEDLSTGNTMTFEQAFDCYANQTDIWYLEDGTCTLGDVRGKILLIRRFAASNTPKGIDCTEWPDNSTFKIPADEFTLYVQDCYKIDKTFGVPQKFSDIFLQLANAAAGQVADWYLNFSSATTSPIPDPIAVAAGTKGTPGINEMLLSHLMTVEAPARFGVVIMDFPEIPRNMLVKKLISMNGLDWSGDWNDPISVTSQNKATTSTGVGLAESNGLLCMAMLDATQSSSENFNVLICTSSDRGSTWTQCITVNGLQGTFQPAIVAFNGKFIIVTVDATGSLWCSSSSDGVAWSPVSQVLPSLALSGSQPALAVQAETLCLAFLDASRSGSGMGNLWCATSSDGVTWEKDNLINVTTQVASGGQQTPLASGGPALAFFGGCLRMFFCDASGNGVLWQMSTETSGKWTLATPVNIDGIQTWWSPAVVVKDDELFLVWLGQKTFLPFSSDILWAVTGDAAFWSDMSSVTKECGAYSASTPALASVHSTLCLAYAVSTPSIPDEVWVTQLKI
jgi:1-phosphatidylinositol phosphodiesterase